MGYYAILGGSFDPIHLGHLHIAGQILSCTDIARVIFMPVRRHHFKSASINADFDTRLRMIKSCLQKGMEAWDEDGGSTGFTADLMKKLHQNHPETKFCFVIGTDNLVSLVDWYDFQWLKDNVLFLVIPRPDFPPDPSMLAMIKAQILQIPLSGVSSSEVRRRALSGESLDGYVPPQIIDQVMRIYGKKS
ncbi:MAG: nicotinate (nicotinamide) nucleotide adenylyltransferase [Candidatus Cloacimonadaceae bacterium]|nr:nicotinate (nicotinamide) nucleotide adenylyltransferase [Candidatus Cloacimonadaceae bacterium]MDP3113745.1 nicotinate (nicotinamide) nucleotide adenylyltransferase [Candidatus Cloacimonadaceae bacterium]